jgi:hypothetical protein
MEARGQLYGPTSFYLLNKRLSCSQSRAGGLGKGKNLFPLPEIESFVDGPTGSPLKIPTELSWLPIFLIFFTICKLKVVLSEKVRRQTFLFHVTT